MHTCHAHTYSGWYFVTQLIYSRSSFQMDLHNTDGTYTTNVFVYFIKLLPKCHLNTQKGIWLHSTTFVNCHVCSVNSSSRARRRPSKDYEDPTSVLHFCTIIGIVNFFSGSAFQPTLPSLGSEEHSFSDWLSNLLRPVMRPICSTVFFFSFWRFREE